MPLAHTLLPLLLACTMNLLASGNDLDRDEEVVFFPTFAPYDLAVNRTAVPIHGCVFEPEASSAWRRAALKQLADALDLPPGERDTATFQSRARLFLVDHERGQELLIKFGEHQVALPASLANGHIEAVAAQSTRDLVALGEPAGTNSYVVPFRLVVPRGDNRDFEGRIHLIGPDGWSIISDIDDTIKDSNVLDKRELMRNTFLRDFRAVEGMAEAYTRWVKAGAVVHYVSGSPWQLYPPLAKFADDAGFPRGTFHLRHFRLHDRSALDLLKAPQEFKLRTIEPILQAFPQRKFALIGDTGEQDPEVYGELARRHPRQVRWIAVRNITDEVAKNDRMKAAFRDVPAERIVLFRNADELPKLEAADGER